MTKRIKEDANMPVYVLEILLSQYYRNGKNLSQRDTIGVCKTVGVFLKLLNPDGESDKAQLEEILRMSMEMRHRVKK